MAWRTKEAGMTVTTPSLVHRTLRPPKGLYHLSFICTPIVKWRVALCLSSTFRVSRTPLDAEGEVQTHKISSQSPEHLESGRGS